MSMLLFLSSVVHARDTQTFAVDGLEQPAEILVDTWGVPHIYAKTHYDVFFVQGFNAARDRLWQIDLWRRRGLGELAEVLGPAFVDQDKAARLFVYRGDMHAEWLAYGSDAKKIAQSFTAGINAYIDLIKAQPDLLPLEFRILGYDPHYWAASDPVRIRSNGLWRNLDTEVLRARIYCQYTNKAGQIDLLRKKLEPNWRVKVPEGLNPCDIPADVLKNYALAKAPVDFTKAEQFKHVQGRKMALNSLELLENRDFDAGSNNWVLSPSRTKSGQALIANDPHRGHAVPSLRYIAHLNAPGIDVIGAGEPALPGISIGHNDNIAFGLTIFAMDQEDLMVYETKKRTRYRYQGDWEAMQVVSEEIAVLGQAPIKLELLFTRHGPVIHEDKANNRAFAARVAWLEPGMAPYFGSVEYMRAGNWREFVSALNRWGAPSENQVYADRQGNIGYKPAGLMPNRPAHDGLLPVPGDGRYEWDGYYDMDVLPEEYNPGRGWIATANAMNLPTDYPYEAIKPGFEWAAPWRSRRLGEVLDVTKNHTINDSLALQRDYLSLPARRVLSALDLEQLPSPANALFHGWDHRLERDSAAAALFEIWFR
ncbi:MAG: penicillin acylase family protein, partial [Gammaproteobacteria bacterium]|nr:penicillin acylase family protein [Gammaproteobacteria bacterium]